MNNNKDEELFDLSLFIFRRDLRLVDNTGLINAMSKSKKVLPLFILTPTQLTNNPLKSDNCIQFMMESLKDLNNQILKHHSNLSIIYGEEIKVINSLYRKFDFDAIFFNSDYSPYSLKRDHKINVWCKNHKVKCFESHDSLLLDTLDIKTTSGNYYKIFTQFYNKTSNIKIRKPERINSFKFQSTNHTISKANLSKYYKFNDGLAINGGRNNAKKILANINKFKSYHKTHDFPSINTTLLSAHNKFGTISIRELYYIIKSINKALLKQLYWRDFYYYVTYHYPHIYKYQHINKQKHITWPHSSQHLMMWKNGQTGFPIIDAAMTQLNETGFMHNRCRMIVAMFLCKTLLIDWKYGEHYFSQKLIDIDRAQNVGNWNWCSSFGLDNATFLRIFNPWTQSKTFDPQAIYIKKWLPKFKNVDPDHIHKWFKYHKEYDIETLKYYKPIVNHDEQRIKFIKFYKKYLK
jgi:deoxyribodipyrimidine photo-lyase